MLLCKNLNQLKNCEEKNNGVEGDFSGIMPEHDLRILRLAEFL
jgi:hypothetical protein